MMIFNASKDTFSNVNKDMYIARKIGVEYDDNNNETIIYDKPFFYGKKNYQPMNLISLQSYMSVYGETKSNVVQLLIDSSEKGKFKEFDVAYLYGATPRNESVYGENANYQVKAFRQQNTKILVILEEIIKEE
nr:MAG TPA: hypothetical protein [Caudoviricetes sp.]